MRKLTKIIQEKAEGLFWSARKWAHHSSMPEFYSRFFFDDCIPVDRKKSKPGNSSYICMYKITNEIYICI